MNPARAFLSGTTAGISGGIIQDTIGNALLANDGVTTSVRNRPRLAYGTAKATLIDGIICPNLLPTLNCNTPEGLVQYVPRSIITILVGDLIDQCMLEVLPHEASKLGVAQKKPYVRSAVRDILADLSVDLVYDLGRTRAARVASMPKPSPTTNIVWGFAAGMTAEAIRKAFNGEEYKANYLKAGIKGAALKATFTYVMGLWQPVN